MKLRVLAAAALAAVAVGGVIQTSLVAAGRATSTASVSIGAPFDGKYGATKDTLPGFGPEFHQTRNSPTPRGSEAHASLWAEDLFALPDTPVVFNVYSDLAVSYTAEGYGACNGHPEEGGYATRI